MFVHLDGVIVVCSSDLFGVVVAVVGVVAVVVVTVVRCLLCHVLLVVRGCFRLVLSLLAVGCCLLLLMKLLS